MLMLCLGSFVIIGQANTGQIFGGYHDNTLSTNNVGWLYGSNTMIFK